MNPTPHPNTWHSMSFDAVIEQLRTSPKGLSSTEVAQRIKNYGPNKITQRKGPGALGLFFSQFMDPLIYILLASSVIAVLMGKTTDAAVIFGVIFINAIIGFVQEFQANNAIRNLLQLVPEYTTVVREGLQKHIESEDLVPGDYVLLQAGDRISADIRLTFAKSLSCNESILTGESLPSEKSTAAVEVNAVVADRKSMVFSGTFVTEGTAEGVVVATGKKTEIGQISELMQSTGEVKSPLTKSIEKIGKTITLAILIVGLLVFIIGLFRHYTLVESMLSAITLAVAAIPEGLPAVITISAAIGIIRLAKRKAVMRHLSSVETLGSTTVICSDKTGTLTRNEMTVQIIWDGENRYTVTGLGTEVQGRTLLESTATEAKEEDIGELMRAGALCNDATLHVAEDGTWKMVGDPTELALIFASRKFGINESSIREEWPRLDVKPFDSVTKRMITLHQSPGDEKVIYLKGAPETVIPLLQKTDAIHPEKIKKEALDLAASGLRILAFAVKRLAPDDRINSLESRMLEDFTFLGLMAMKDPPREEVKTAIKKCHDAGIVVKMITGDHPATALAIAKELALSKNELVVTGQELQQMDDAALQETVKTTDIYARVSPEDKLRLVKALQANGEIVAMTGDGVNDAPALKRADIGISMGVSGTAVAREASDMILVNDNFESIEAAVEEGRHVFDNLLKGIVFILPTSIGLGLVTLFAVSFFPTVEGVLIRPMLPVQVLWVNLITAVALTLPLALEAMEPDVMNRPPRDQQKPFLSAVLALRMIIVALVMAGGTVGLFLWEYNIELEKGIDATKALAEAQTMAVTAMVFFQIFYLLNCRSLKYNVGAIGYFSNPFIYLGIFVVLLAQLFFVYAPIMNRWFSSLPLNLEAWSFSAAVAASILVIVGIEKWITSKLE
ncbi:ATPase, P-type (transporting), HAD superfamily, subfamily IC [Haliscomenobacter hydrossis DSM 1100]|uniref:ATPase, P-type (Transporting), HAD superfamily, subfamily IC n=2 Tax=Haliscomenobacter TaxID=2349 RepID=F4KS90_HALH1|nr:ATPase, P-type (transporting), HAD superfamily, subfamily IC [Haliscomenobacter hydrossis DSM 1100]